LKPHPSFVTIDTTLVRNSSTAARYIQARHNPHLDHVDCPAIFRNDGEALETARAYMKDNAQNFISDEEFIAQTNDCTLFARTVDILLNRCRKKRLNSLWHSVSLCTKICTRLRGCFVQFTSLRTSIVFTLI
jgi:hypothetical protein